MGANDAALGSILKNKDNNDATITNRLVSSNEFDVTQSDNRPLQADNGIMDINEQI